MRFLARVIACLVLAAPALAQTGMTNMTASHIRSDISGQLLTGKLCLTPVIGTVPTGFTDGTGAQNLPAQVCYTATSGVLNISVPDTSLTTPEIGYKVVAESASGVPLYSYSQPIFPAGTSWNFDTWAPSHTSKVTSPTVSYSTSAPIGDCGSAPAIDYSGTIQTGISLYTCVQHSWQPPNTGIGGGGAQGPKGDTGATGASGTAATISAGTATAGTAGSQPSVTNRGTSSAAIFDFVIPAGAAGVKGDTGATGATGTAATVTVGTVNTGAAGTSASVTNRGTASAAIFDFVIPQGVPGDGSGSVQADWDALSGLTAILHKPTLGTASAQDTTAFDAAGTAAASLVSAKAYTDGKASNYDAAGSATTAQTAAVAAAKTYSDGLAGNYDAAGAATTALASAKTYTDGASEVKVATQGNLFTDASKQVRGLLNIGTVSIFGDSYFSDWGASSPYTGFTYLLQRDTPAPVTRYAIGGATAPTVAQEVVSNFVPDLTRVNVVLLDGGANDGTADTHSSTFPTGSVQTTDYTAFMSAAIAQAAIPASHRLMASTSSITGGWGAVNGIFAIANGTPMVSGNGGQTLSFTVPSSTATELGIVYQVTNSAAANFTVTVDGTLVNNLCTGTTIWHTQPCNVTMAAGSQSATTGTMRQEVAVTPNQSHTVLITSGAAAVTFDAVDYPVSGAPTAGGNNLVYVMGPNANFALPTVYDWFTNNLVTAFAAEGLPVFFIDQQAGTPGVNSTTDLSTTATATCPASTRAGHPNDCGYEHMRQTLDSVETSSGYRWSFPYSGVQARGSVVGPLNVETPTDNNTNLFANYNALASYNTTTSKNGSGVLLYRDQFTTAGFGSGFDSTSGNPSSGRYVNRVFGTYNATFNCDASLTITAATATSPATFTESSFVNTNCNRPSSGDGWRSGVQAYKEGSAITVSGAGVTIAPITQIVHVAGTGSIATITPTATIFLGTTNEAATYVFIADAAWTTVTTGNISNAVTAVAGTVYFATYTGSTGKWVISPTQGPQGATGPSGTAGNAAGDVTGPYTDLVVGRINGTSLAGLGTGLLKNTTGTGVPSIAAPGTDYQPPLGFTAVPNTTTVNGHPLTVNVVVSASDLSTGTLPHAQLPALVSADIPNNTANTGGSAGSLSGTQTANFVYAAPNGSSGAAAFRALVAADLPKVTRALGWSFGDAATGAALTTSEVGYITVPFSCTITGWHIMVDAGTATLKVARLNGGTALPTITNSINTSGIAISTGTKIDSTTLTDFTSTAIAPNDTLGFLFTATSGVKQLTIQLDCAQ